MASCFAVFEATELLENIKVSRFRDEDSKDGYLATPKAVFLLVRVVESDGKGSGKPV